MKIVDASPLKKPSGTDAAGFTLLDLAAVLAVIAVLVVLQLPVLAGGKSQTKISVCASNVRQIALACQLYANDYSSKLPVLSGSAAWARTAGGLQTYGVATNTFYCPGTAPRFTDQDNWIASGTSSLWNFGASAGFHVVGYALAFSGTTSDLNSTNQNTTILPETTKVGSAPVAAPAASERVLVADATISSGATVPGYAHPENNYTSIPGGFYKQHVSPHLQGAVPMGGNIGFKDGHVAWRKFEVMTPRTVSGTVFWW